MLFKHCSSDINQLSLHLGAYPVAHIKRGPRVCHTPWQGPDGLEPRIQSTTPSPSPNPQLVCEGRGIDEAFFVG